jgi:L-ribulokinase
MSNAGEGGPWGMAILAMYAADNQGQSLSDYLDYNVFNNPESMTLSPEPEGVAAYNEFTKHYEAGLPVEARAGEVI